MVYTNVENIFLFTPTLANEDRQKWNELQQVSPRNGWIRVGGHLCKEYKGLKISKVIITTDLGRINGTVHAMFSWYSPCEVRSGLLRDISNHLSDGVTMSDEPEELMQWIDENIERMSNEIHETLHIPLKYLHICAYANGSSALEIELPMEDWLVAKIESKMKDAQKQGVSDNDFYTHLQQIEPELAKSIADSFEKWLQDYLEEHLDWACQIDDESTSFWANLLIDHCDPDIMGPDSVSPANSFAYIIPYVE